MKPNSENNGNLKNMPEKSYILEKCQIFGENMRHARKDRGFTSEALAKFLQISTAYVGLIERGERCPSLETFLKICDFFGENPTDMLTSRDGINVSEVKAKSGKGASNAQSNRKQKMAVSMINTFGADEMDHIISVIKSFKAYSHSRRGAADAEFGAEISFMEY